MATTQFIDDSDVVIRDESHIDHLDPSWLTLNDTQSIEQTLMSFLNKPIVLAQSTFSVSDTYSFFNSYFMPNAALTSTPGQLWLNKLYGFFGIRMDMRFKLVVNANKFQQGRYMVGWVPFAGAHGTSSDLKLTLFNNMHMATLIQRTTVPHVEIDLNTQTTAELLVPFTSTQNFWPINSAISTSNYSCLGAINVYPYVPMSSPAGSTVASYTLYVSFENIQLFGASSPQSGLSKRETANKQNGPVSGIAASISRGFKEFKNVPLLSEIATPVAWVADRVASVASIFGFSKPTQGDSLTKFEITNVPNHTTVDGDSDAKALSYLSLPSTTVPKGISGSDFDEMDFSFITRKYAYVNQFAWNVGTASGNLATINVTPNVNITNTGVISWTPLAFVSKFFKYWRGSIKYRFKIVKTEFHSGRIQISFYPTDEASYTADPYYVNRQIIDIRDNIEFEVIVPYISRFPYTAQASSIGVLKIDIVDALVAPATVASSVTFVYEHCAGDDMEFGIPAGFSYNPQYAIPQSGLTTDKQVSFTIGNTSVAANPVISSAFCIGDKVSSFRAYLKRFSPITPNTKAAGNTYRLNGSSVYMQPDIIPVLSTATTTNFYNADILSCVASCYMMMSGGIRLRDILDLAVANSPANVPYSNLLTANLFDPIANVVNGIVFTQSTNGLVDPNQHLVVQASSLNNTLTIEIPQYTNALARNMVDIIAFQADSPPSYYGYQSLGSTTQLAVTINAPNSLVNGTAAVANYDLHNLYRSLADDGNLMGFISVPPFVAATTTSSGNFY